MSKGRTLRWQTGRWYRIKNVEYLIPFSSTKEEEVKKRAKKYVKPRIRREGRMFNLLVPAFPSMTSKNFKNQLKLFKPNLKKLRGK